MCTYAYRIGTGTGTFGPLPAVFLLARLRLGVLLTVAIISSDVALNAWVGATLGATRGFESDAFIAQGMFLIFVGTVNSSGFR